MELIGQVGLIPVLSPPRLEARSHVGLALDELTSLEKGSHLLGLFGTRSPFPQGLCASPSVERHLEVLGAQPSVTLLRSIDLPSSKPVSAGLLRDPPAFDRHLMLLDVLPLDGEVRDHRGHLFVGLHL